MIYDFEFANESARDHDLMVCDFNGGKDIETINIGAEANFNPVPARHGTIQYITDVTYDAVLEITISVCKINCSHYDPYFSIEDCRNITNWLNREENHMLRLMSDEEIYDHVQFEGTFNVNAIKLDDKVIGFELHFISNRPFAIGHETCFHFVANNENGYIFSFEDMSDKIGYIYPNSLIITCHASTSSENPLVIKHIEENRETRISNCSIGEIITFTDALDISTNLENHYIQNDFNYQFFRIANSNINKTNTIQFSHPCEISFSYYPIVKGVGL